MSQGFLEDEMAWSDTGDFMHQLWPMFFADYTMANIQNFSLTIIVDVGHVYDPDNLIFGHH